MIALDEDLAVIDQMLDQYPLLSNDEMKALAHKVRAGDKDARDKMILHNLRLVVSEAKLFTSPQTFPDCFQEAVEGLIRAVDKYDPDLGYSFSTYAVWWIKQAVRIWMFQRHKVYIPRYMHDSMLKIRKYCSESERDPAVIAEKTGMEVDRVINAQMAMSMHYVSMDAPVDGVDASLTLADMLMDEHDPLEDIEDNERTRQIAHEMLAMLAPRDQEIMRMYFGFDGESLTIPEIAPRLGISRERVRQLHLRAMGIMQTWSPDMPPPPTDKNIGTCLCGCGEQIELVLDHGGNRKFVDRKHRERYYYYQQRAQKAEEQSA